MDTTFLKYFITEDIYVIDEAPKNENDRSDLLVEEPKVEYQKTVKPQPVVTGTCVVVKSLADRENEMLQKLLSAIKVGEPDYVDQLDLKSGHKNYLIFGDFSTEEKYVVHEKQGMRMLVSDEMHQLDTDEMLKRKLWTQLQKMFL